MQFLKREAEEVTTDEPFRLFIKSGGFKQAVADFKAIETDMFMPYGVCSYIYNISQNIPKLLLPHNFAFIFMCTIKSINCTIMKSTDNNITHLVLLES